MDAIRKRMRRAACAALAFGFISCTAAAAMAATPSEIREEISAYEEELSETEVALDELDAQISETSDEAAAAYAEIQALAIKRQSYVEGMSARIAYFYENESNNGLMESIVTGDGFAAMISRAENTAALHEYDSEQLGEYKDALEKEKELQAVLDAKVSELEGLRAEQEARKAGLEETISGKEAELAEAEAAEKKASSSGSSRAGALTKKKGVVYYNGHRETWYSQRVLAGGGLNIPGRHVEPSDGTIRDADGYICVASSDLAKGAVVETSLGTGKVYDSGCASGTIDIYTDW